MQRILTCFNKNNSGFVILPFETLTNCYIVNFDQLGPAVRFGLFNIGKQQLPRRAPQDAAIHLGLFSLSREIVIEK